MEKLKELKDDRASFSSICIKPAWFVNCLHSLIFTFNFVYLYLDAVRQYKVFQGAELTLTRKQYIL